MGVPSYSARFVQPFAEVLARAGNYDPRELAKIRAIDPLGRLPIQDAHELVLEQIAATGDTELGVKAARVAGLGHGGALDYAMNTAPTVRRSLEIGGRYTRLLSDSLSVHHEVRNGRAMVRLESSIPAPRQVPDFAMAFWYLNHTRTPIGESPKIECWFEHPKPANVDEYDRTYGDATLRFDAPCYGFTFDRECLDLALPGTDPGLHALLCERVALMAATLTACVTVQRRVRELAIASLGQGDLRQSDVARQLRMSPRTLAGRLEREGTTFTDVVDGLRKDLALSYLDGGELQHTDIAFRLGFAHVEAFYRAFKRWTGQTPLAYRKARTSRPPAVGEFPANGAGH
jgi:AraC-like DNA-binding protein